MRLADPERLDWLVVESARLLQCGGKSETCAALHATLSGLPSGSSPIAVWACHQRHDKAVGVGTDVSMYGRLLAILAQDTSLSVAVEALASKSVLAPDDAMASCARSARPGHGACRCQLDSAWAARPSGRRRRDDGKPLPAVPAAAGTGQKPAPADAHA